MRAPVSLPYARFAYESPTDTNDCNVFVVISRDNNKHAARYCLL